MKCTCTFRTAGQIQPSNRDESRIVFCPLHNAADDMLEALKIALPVYESVYLDFCEKDDKELENNFFENLEKIKAAIFKAQGKENPET